MHFACGKVLPPHSILPSYALVLSGTIAAVWVCITKYLVCLSVSVIVQYTGWGALRILCQISLFALSGCSYNKCILVMILNGDHEAVSVLWILLKYIGSILQKEGDTLGVAILSSHQKWRYLQIIEQWYLVGMMYSLSFVHQLWRLLCMQRSIGSGYFYTKFMLMSLGMWSNINYHRFVWFITQAYTCILHHPWLFSLISQHIFKLE